MRWRQTSPAEAAAAEARLLSCGNHECVLRTHTHKHISERRHTSPILSPLTHAHHTHTTAAALRFRFRFMQRFRASGGARHAHGRRR